MAVCVLVFRFRLLEYLAIAVILVLEASRRNVSTVVLLIKSVQIRRRLGAAARPLLPNFVREENHLTILRHLRKVGEVKVGREVQHLLIIILGVLDMLVGRPHGLREEELLLVRVMTSAPAAPIQPGVHRQLQLLRINLL